MATKKQPVTHSKFLPIFIFMLLGIGMMYFGFTTPSKCVVAPTVQQCEWWNVFCSLGNVIQPNMAGQTYQRCIDTENIMRYVFIFGGAFVTLFAIRKYQ